MHCHGAPILLYWLTFSVCLSSVHTHSLSLLSVCVCVLVCVRLRVSVCVCINHTFCCRGGPSSVSHHSVLHTCVITSPVDNLVISLAAIEGEESPSFSTELLSRKQSVLLAPLTWCIMDFCSCFCIPCLFSSVQDLLLMWVTEGERFFFFFPVGWDWICQNWSLSLQFTFYCWTFTVNKHTQQLLSCTSS